jgi:hypothetical protein
MTIEKIVAIVGLALILIMPIFLLVMVILTRIQKYVDDRFDKKNRKK